MKKGVDPHALKEEMLEILNTRGAEYPAEHNVGHLYKAKPQLKAFYKATDPTNTLNPGLGKTSKLKYWGKGTKDVAAESIISNVNKGLNSL